MIDKAIWYVRRLLQMAGWPAISSIVLVSLVIAFYFLTLAPLQKNATDFKHDAESLRGKIVARRSGSSDQVIGGQLAAFYAFFPQTDTLTETLSKLYGAAAKQNLVLDQGEYHLTPTQEGRLVRYDIVLPVKGPYPKLRSFVAEALKDNSNLALEGVTFNRQTATDIGVDSQVRLTLYMRAVQP